MRRSAQDHASSPYAGLIACAPFDAVGHELRYSAQLTLARFVLHGVGNPYGRWIAKCEDPYPVTNEVALCYLRALVVTAVGLVGLAVNFKKLQHDTTIEKIVFAVGAATIACVAYLLLVR